MLQSNSALENLLISACPSIKYRVGSDFLKKSLNSDDMRSIQAEILLDPLVKKIIESQTSGGWLGLRFHGYDSFESGLRILVEKGVSWQHPAFMRAMDALEKDSIKISQDMGSFGRYFDEQRLGGTKLIQAWLLALGGRSDNPLVKEQIDVVLEGMKSVLLVKSYTDAVEVWKDRLVYKPGIQWPGIYHLRLLADTQEWRTPENQIMIIQSLQKLVQYSPMLQAYVRKGSQWIAPASYAMLDFNPEMNTLDSLNWMLWFHRTELLARMGVIHANGIFDSQLTYLKNCLAKNDGRFVLPLKHDSFKHWGSYTGLALETDWKNPTRRINDLTFRSYLILNNTKPLE